MKLSLCMPTWNRAAMLDYTMRRVLEAYGDQVELVVADNNSTDDTPSIVSKHQSTHKNVKYVRHKEVPPYLGQVIALRNASCQYVAFMADDDWVFPTIFEYVAQLDARPDLVAVYSDLIAWDDDREEELHRYFYLPSAVEFGVWSGKEPMDLMNFVCGDNAAKSLIYPEIGVFRQEAFIRSDCILSRGNIPNHKWMYRMSRLGVIRFESCAKTYYRENRIVKSHLQRSEPSNLRLRLQYIGDEFRNALETVMLWALRDSGEDSCPASQWLTVRRMIDGFMHRKLAVEINRAVHAKDYIAAVELAERLHLWNGGVQIGDIGKRACVQAAEAMGKLLGGVHLFEKDDGLPGDGKRLYFDRLMQTYGALAQPIMGTGTLSLGTA